MKRALWRPSAAFLLVISMVLGPPSPVGAQEKGKDSVLDDILEARPAAAEASQAISDLREKPATLKSSIFSALLLS
jgi:hypothetical protein